MGMDTGGTVVRGEARRLASTLRLEMAIIELSRGSSPYIKVSEHNHAASDTGIIVRFGNCNIELCNS